MSGNDSTMAPGAVVCGQPVSIAAMPPWHFWARPECVDSTEDECVAMGRGELPADRIDALRTATRLLAAALVNAQPVGSA
jgi:hypothetical protein